MWVALHNGQFSGYVTLKWISHYQSFKDQHIPEIMDLNVLPPHRNKGVGLYGDYGSAQKLYIKKGYIPDGYGVTYNYQLVTPGDSAPVDDDLVLWFTKDIS